MTRKAFVKQLQSRRTTGRLIMLSTHIGNEQDIPARSIAALQSADLLIFEEDRPARVALKAAKVHREYLKFSEHIQKETLEQVHKSLLKGETVAYMSDQGCPSLADPGRPLLELAFQLGAKLTVVPGPSSVTAAISACPFYLDRYQFIGFLPRQEHIRRRVLSDLADVPMPHILMDTPYRLKSVLESCCASLPASRHGFLALDITGDQEQYLVGRFDKLIERCSALDKNTNFVLIIDGHKSPQSNSSKSTRRGKR